MNKQNYETIILAVEHSKLKKIRDVFAVEDSVNTLLCKFEFRSEEWSCMVKTAVFVRDNCDCYEQLENKDFKHVLLDENDECVVPYEVLQDYGYFSVGVFGEYGEDVLPTNLVKFRCHMGCYSDGTVPSKPTQSIYDQITGELAKKQNILVPGENITIENNVISAVIPYEYIDKNYIHNQTTASNVWNIVHNLGKYPSVSVVDSARNVVIGEINYLNENELTISFIGEFSGKAFLN